MRRTLGWVGRVIPNPPLSVSNPSDRRVKDNAPYPADATLLAFTVALLWTLHPLQTEAVTYIIQRTESLMGLFFLLTFYCFSRAASSPRPWPWRVLTVLACLGGVGAKEVGTTAPLLVFLYDRTFVAGTFREAWRRRRWRHLSLAATWVPLALLVASTGWNRGGAAGFNVGVSPSQSRGSCVKYQYTLDFLAIENQESAMSRRVRLEYAGACYHVINRGNYRRDLFAGKGAARFNRFRGEAGRPFQGRYRALHVEPGEALGEVAHYIHLNPVRAKVLPVERLLEYRWSSLPWLVRKPRPAWLVSGTVLAGSGGLADTPAGWRSYLGYLAVRAEESADAREAKFGRLSQGWALGSADFQADLLEQLSTTTGRETGFDLLGADRQAHQQVRSAQWERALRSAAKALGIQLDHLPAKKSAAEKVRLAALMTQRTSVCNAWLADRLQMGVPGAVTQYVRRFRLQGETQTQSFQTALLKIHT